jgi:hypothetical protein
MIELIEPMPTHLILTIPTTDPTLRRELEQGVEEYADVTQAKSYTDLETVKLVLGRGMNQVYNETEKRL